MNVKKNIITSYSKRRGKGSHGRKYKSSLLVGVQRAMSFPFRVILLLLKSSWFPALLLVGYFFIYSSNFVILLDPMGAQKSLLFTSTGGGFTAAVEKERIAEAFKSSIGLVFYICSVLLMLAYFREILQFTRRNIHFIIMLTFPIIGMYVSVIPEKVLYSVIQLYAGFFIALAYAFSRTDRSVSFVNLCLLLLLPTAAIHVASVGLLYVHDIDYMPFIEGAARYGGLAGNPNTLGSSATIGSWLALYVLMDRNPGPIAKALAIVCLMFFLFSIAVSGSGTSKATVAMVFSVMLGIRLYLIAKGNASKLIYVYSVALMLILGSGFYFINYSISDLGTSVVGGLGKETDLTGRTDIWGMGLAALADRPVFGWGLDSHETVLGYAQYEVPFGINHYHNGYIDTAVSSGLLALLFVLYNIGKYIRLFFSNFQFNKWSFGMVGPLIILIMHNFSEYSLMRPLNIVYQLYMCAFCLLAVSLYYRQNEGQVIRSSNTGKKKRKSRKKHYSFG